jgi:pantoate--beta-alanine ligase
MTHEGLVSAGDYIRTILYFVGAIQVVDSIAAVRAALSLPGRGRIGLVPTMGAFHAGHVSLFDAAGRECDTVVVSLFVNPTQFGDPRDLERYPRDLPRDIAMAESAGVDILFTPDADEIYPAGFDTSVEVHALSHVLEGASRPGHFRGVATVCLKLFNIMQPDAVYFGQKDAQQVAVIRRMIRDLDLSLQLRVLPTVRDTDGLALSSRNVRLTPEGRAQALALPRALATRDADRARAMLAGMDVDYVEIAPFDPPVLAAAIRVGGVRLIDNVVLEGE